ncbi:inner membrane protein YpjD [Kroppenstedtia eburnea]|uniref:HemX family protein n=1 Tax=Kroppenstedtia eburnea TaxID=714067 RepID=A0A1N7M250_9BACL|nr:cytochrome c biogenesis protein CcsA [Kroppenstedtia eburnea]QKI81787.1 cytochrome c biogenesis protein CcsA [Kroppenstedtia eburnea]SIS80154.1 HemX family protein [Kroppenstedtia eburnea]
MFAQGWFYDLIIYIYVLSLLFAFSDLLQPSRRLRRLALLLLMTVWFFQTVFLTWTLSTRFPALSGTDSLLFYSWILVTLSLVLDRVYKNDFLIFSTNLPGFAFLAAHLYIAPESAPLSKPLLSELVFIHVTLAFLAYALFSLSAVTAVLYLFGCKLLKRKRWNQTLRRLPSLGSLQHFSNRMVMIGVPLLILALVLGGVWANKQMGGAFWYDPKIFSSIFVLFAYLIYLYQRAVRGWNGQRLAWWNIVSFITVVINYLISNAGFSFHQWL